MVAKVSSKQELYSDHRLGCSVTWSPQRLPIGPIPAMCTAAHQSPRPMAAPGQCWPWPEQHGDFSSSFFRYYRGPNFDGVTSGDHDHFFRPLVVTYPASVVVNGLFSGTCAGLGSEPGLLESWPDEFRTEESWSKTTERRVFLQGTGTYLTSYVEILLPYFHFMDPTFNTL